VFVCLSKIFDLEGIDIYGSKIQDIKDLVARFLIGFAEENMEIIRNTKSKRILSASLYVRIPFLTVDRIFASYRRNIFIDLIPERSTYHPILKGFCEKLELPELTLEECLRVTNT